MTEKAAIEQRTIVDGNEKELASDKHTKAVKRNMTVNQTSTRLYRNALHVCRMS